MSFAPAARLAALVIALCAGGGVVGQLLLDLGKAEAAGQPLWPVPLALYGYFTIWTNTLVAVLAAHVARGGPAPGRLGSAPSQAAAVTYIIVVGIIYNSLLAAGRHLAGGAWLCDFLLHTVVPIAWPLWWLMFARHGGLRQGHIVRAMEFPLAYCLVALARGTVTGKYAYFFIDLATYGWPRVLLNIAGLVLLFAGLMAALVAYDRWRAGAALPAR